MFGRLVSSSASIRSPASFAPSAANRSRLLSGIRRESVDESAQSQLVAVGPKPRHGNAASAAQTFFSSGSRA